MWSGEQAGEIDQVFGVLRCRNAACQNGIVAGLFAFEAKPAGNSPRQRVEPGDGAQRFRKQLPHPVAPADVFAFIDRKSTRLNSSHG